MGKRTLMSLDKDKFLKLVIPEPNSGCWLWVGHVQWNHYGKVSTITGKRVMAHRVSYQFFSGEIPKGKLICHKCNNRYCVNPSHLYVGDESTNGFDAVANKSHVQSRKTHCVNGHPFSGNNLILWKNGRIRVCRVCRNAQNLAFRTKKRLAEATNA